MIQRGLQCYLCVERPPPADLKNHLMFHHMIENDLAVMTILQMHGKKHCETQTTVTWTQDFDYYDDGSTRRKSEISTNSIVKFKKSKNHLNKSIAKNNLKKDAISRNFHCTKDIMHTNSQEDDSRVYNDKSGATNGEYVISYTNEGLANNTSNLDEIIDEILTTDEKKIEQCCRAKCLARGFQTS